MTPAAFALADWGTTHLRLWLVDAGGAVLAESRGPEGMGTLKPDAFAAVLEARLAALSADPRLPVAICGMAGSRQGWREAPYARVPVKAGSLLDHGAAFVSGVRRVHIVSGLARPGADRADVMRGEETQLIGLPLAPSGAALVCMPGTHSKWVTIGNGTITDFLTVMTGEMHALLSRHSILAHSIGNATADPEHPAFAAAVRLAVSGPRSGLSGLFSVRAATLIEGADASAAASRLSGHLIGTEIAEAVARFGTPSGPVHVVGSANLLAFYGKALALAGLAADLHDGDAAARAGLYAVARHVFSADATKAAQ